MFGHKYLNLLSNRVINYLKDLQLTAGGLNEDLQFSIFYF